ERGARHVRARRVVKPLIEAGRAAHGRRRARWREDGSTVRAEHGLDEASVVRDALFEVRVGRVKIADRAGEHHRLWRLDRTFHRASRPSAAKARLDAVAADAVARAGLAFHTIRHDQIGARTARDQRNKKKSKSSHYIH